MLLVIGKRTSALWLIGLGLAGTGSLRYDGAVPFFLLSRPCPSICSITVRNSAAWGFP